MLLDVINARHYNSHSLYSSSTRSGISPRMCLCIISTVALVPLRSGLLQRGVLSSVQAVCIAAELVDLRRRSASVCLHTAYYAFANRRVVFRHVRPYYGVLNRVSKDEAYLDNRVCFFPPETMVNFHQIGNIAVLKIVVANYQGYRFSRRVHEACSHRPFLCIFRVCGGRAMRRASFFGVAQSEEMVSHPAHKKRGLPAAPGTHLAHSLK